MQVKAVEYPVLYKYTDVIVCSVKGSRRFIDYLAGGTFLGRPFSQILTNHG